jgi:hypothetical protein
MTASLGLRVIYSCTIITSAGIQVQLIAINLQFHLRYFRLIADASLRDL